MTQTVSTGCSGARLLPSQVTAVRDAAAPLLDDTRYQSPPERYIESKFPTAGLRNPVYALVRRLFMAMGLDRANMGTKRWNPLSEFLKRGDQVVVKPNLVHHRHYRGGKLHWVITDPRVIRAVCDYAFLAVGREGHVIVGDAPLQSADWNSLIRESQLDRLPVFYSQHGYLLTLTDFRTVRTTDRKGMKCSPVPLPGDPNGYAAVDLGADSLHAGRDWRRFRVTNYNPEAMRSHHNDTRHEYLIARSILHSPMVINLPKLKTHRKCGLTGPLKNMVGINGCKDWLPHHSGGSVPEGGDEYSDISAWKKLNSWLVEREESAARLAGKLSWNAARRFVYGLGNRLTGDQSWEGSWHGNDTLWRTILDLNRAALYADPDGTLRPRTQRTMLTIVDAIQAGESEGPMAPEPVPLGTLLASINPLTAEIAATRLAGWPEGRLRLIQGAFHLPSYPLDPFTRESVEIQATDFTSGTGAEATLEEFARFLRPSRGWGDVKPVLMGQTASQPPVEVNP